MILGTTNVLRYIAFLALHKLLYVYMYTCVPMELVFLSGTRHV